ncbi:MAG TPA: Rv2231c family pyridoxal phosphate-dependent protein CobC [Intrasporangium sp.]|uniref:Rv2231c family pyridoxal phosphate-dependent protein CobC n=1 Tax=Intrasporangium sp. TaxID=1925024 RepID=UPI002D778E9C|nr:Rv2231c family pyridoxal phosphate-dependent protein CobC [Intrasporangium sp.]HET7399637.1 Rv2231c family pyridoxal phosphate-dependent protein CobC [Intrasporangium sp.]
MSAETTPAGVDLLHHGDDEAAEGLLDFAVNVSSHRPPAWLADRLRAAVDGLGRYPDPRPARRALAALHGIPEDCVLVVAGAAEAFTLVAGLPWRRPVVVHPQFTEPDAALRAHGHDVEWALLDPADGFSMHGKPAVDPLADLVVVGNPTNPTSRVHAAPDLLRLCAPGRLLLVDEAFLDAVEPPERPVSSLVPRAARADGVAVVRSLTKTFAIPGLRVGYVVGRPDVLRALRRRQPRWAVGSLACAAAVACAGEDGQRHAADHRRALPARLDALSGGLTRAGLHVVREPRAPFVLARHPQGHVVRERLRDKGIAVRRGDTFPGLGPQWLRFAARGPGDLDRLLAGLRQATRPEETT